jgi:Asp-tRNA(Asn)/Glu-tRNA(Gln) amidotransferase A subunit family amidase
MIHRHVAFVLTVVVVSCHAHGVTPVESRDGQFWDVQDTSTWGQDSGGIATGGRANPFNGFGYLKLQVRKPDQSLLIRNHYLRGFGLSFDGQQRFDSITPVLCHGIAVARSIWIPKDKDYLRYFDSFTNMAAEDRIVEVAWGGATGACEDGGKVAVATTSDGDHQIDVSDRFVTVMQNARSVADPMQGPSGHGPSAHIVGSASAQRLTSIGDMYGDPFTSSWPGFDPAHIGYVFTLKLKPGQTAALVTFVVKGLSEVYDPRGGFPVSIRDGLVATGFEEVYGGDDPRIPPAGSEITRVTEIARRLVDQPDFRELTPRQLNQIANWSIPDRPELPPFSVFEKSVPQLQAAMARGEVTSEDIVREYLMRASTYDRSGPTFRAILALNPSVVAQARQRDAERMAGKARGPFHGVPVLYKDNIDVLELPTTGGSRALVDYRPRRDSHVAARMRKGGAIVLGKANLDEFPFGDFGVSSVGGTVGNAYDPSLSTSGSSGGSATAVAASLAPIAFGTDTCNSLSNPAAFASLATIRATRGLVSRAGVMPLHTFNDAVGPMAKSVGEIALALDLIAGTDADDPVTAPADSHIRGSFSDGLETATLKGRRIGVLRQRFVGFTGEREVAASMDRVIREFANAGATLVDVTIPDYDARYRAVRGSAPGSLKDAWMTYLARGAGDADRPLTIEDLLKSGRLAPAAVERFKDALKPAPSGAELEEATRQFLAGREVFRQIFVDLMDEHRADALLYPANQARPHTHEGGLVRYGSEPGTCQESAATGLPQVTVPAGFFGQRYPLGVSLLGRMWDDRKLLEMAAAYERATSHRRPPTTMEGPGMEVDSGRVGQGTRPDPRWRKVDINSQSAFEAACIADFNGDDKLDIFCGDSWYQAPNWHRHKVREVPASGPNPHYYEDFADLPLDVNGDGRSDIVTCTYFSGRIGWVENTSASHTNWIEHDIDTPGPCETAQLVDINGDGQLDLLPNTMNAVVWYELQRPAGEPALPANVKDGLWKKHRLGTEGVGHGIGAGDINRDGRLDILTPKGWYEQPDQATDDWKFHAEFELGAAGILILGHDFDQDHDTDVVWGMGHDYGLFWLRQHPTSGGGRQWQRNEIDTTFSQVHTLLLSDLDGDSTPELVTGKRVYAHEVEPGATDSPCVYYFRRDLTGWSRHTIYEGVPAGSAPQGAQHRWALQDFATGSAGTGLQMDAGDIDADGDIDLVCPGKSGLYLFENY